MEEVVYGCLVELTSGDVAMVTEHIPASGKVGVFVGDESSAQHVGFEYLVLDRPSLFALPGQSAGFTFMSCSK